MKFKYNDKNYVVFADVDEIIFNQLLIKVNDSYLKHDKICGGFDELSTTEVLNHLSCGSRILQAYALKLKHVTIDTLYAETLSGTLSDTINLLNRLVNNYQDARITFVSNWGKEYYVITRSTEETEEEAKTRLGCNWNKVKYYEP